MTVTVYKSTDASAPTCTGQAGSLTTLLDAVLVNGYGSKSSQGYTIAYTATNQRAYKCGTGNQRYLQVDDTAAGSAIYARVSGWEAMTAYNTGTNQFPSSVQVSGGLYVHKSATADGTARPWFAWGNGKLFYLFVATDSSASNPIMGASLIFGDFTSYVSGDAYNTILIAGTTTTATMTNLQNHVFAQSFNHASGNGLVGHYVCRAYTGLGTSVACVKFTNNGMAGSYSASNSVALAIGYPAVNLSGTTIGAAMLYPNIPDSGLYLERLWLGDSSYLRGELPGMWAPLHNTPLSHLDTFSGSGSLSGKTFEVHRCAQASTGPEVFMETSNTW